MVEAPDFSQGSGVFTRRGTKVRSYVVSSLGPLRHSIAPMGQER
jgi:hypothetical protein